MASINESVTKIIESQNNSTLSIENVMEGGIGLIRSNNENNRRFAIINKKCREDC